MNVLKYLLFLVAMPVLAAQVTEDPLERKMLEIAKDLRCTVCQNQPVSESNAELAQDMRTIIREQIKAGKSRHEIINYFVERYGDYVLMQPPTTGAGTLVWLGPLVLVIVVGVSGFAFLRRRLRPTLPPPPQLTREDAERVRVARRQDKP
jgi:cytochrome c-type biogenesis protein CcmH